MSEPKPESQAGAPAERCCPRYPDCTGRFYEPHWCAGAWAATAQDKLDACTTMAELRKAWRRLEHAGHVDLIYGAEWHHAVAHLRYQQAQNAENGEG